MKESKQFRSAYSAALRYLLSQPRTYQEVKKRLERKGFDPTVADQVLTRLQELGYVNDGEFARRWLEAEIRRKPQGRHFLRRKLEGRGIDAAIAADSLEAIYDRAAETASALEAARKKLPFLDLSDPDKCRGKLGQHLQRRGFDYAIIRHVLAAVLNADE